MSDLQIKKKTKDGTTVEVSGQTLEAAKDLARRAFMIATNDEAALLLLDIAKELIVRTRAGDPKPKKRAWPKCVDCGGPHKSRCGNGLTLMERAEKKRGMK